MWFKLITGAGMVLEFGFFALVSRAARLCIPEIDNGGF
jgi:hypothetical protein